MADFKFSKTVGIGILSLTVFASSGLVYASKKSSDTDANKIFSIPVSHGEGEIGYTPLVEDLELRGPESFAVSVDGTVYLLDTIESQVEVFDKDGIHLDTIQLPEDIEFRDIELSGKHTIYVLNDLGEVYEIYKNEVKKVHTIPVDDQRNNIVGLFQTKKNEVVVRYLDGTEIDLNSKKVSKKYDGYKGTKAGKNIVLESSDDKIEVKYSYEAAGTYPLQYTNEGEQFILENEALIGEELFVETRVEKFKNGRSKGTAIAISTKDNYYTKVPNKFVYAAKNGKVYQMVSTKDSIDLYELKFDNNRTNITKSLIKDIQPKEVSEKKSISIQTVTASNAMDRAIDMIHLDWRYDPSIHKTPSTSTTQPPQHLANLTSVTTISGIPYCWGGADGVDRAYNTSSWTDFVDGLSKGKKAGNIDTDAGWVSSTVGVDCSGYVSVAYDFGKKYNTSQFASSTSPFMSTTWANIKFGDIGNKSGVHVWMWEDYKRNSYGEITGYWTREATTDGSTDEAKYYSRTLSDAQSYKPMTLK